MGDSVPDSTECSLSLADNTSPSQLQEVTLDQDATFSNTMGLRSPGCPMRGRSVKEFEEQLTNLKKENFNLKLRIYFLEEKMGTNFTLDKDNVVKKNIELQVEIANLQNEVQEKHELLCQAVKAIELEDEEHKKYVAQKDDELNQLQQELEDVRLQLQESRFDSDGLSVKSDATGFYTSRATNSGNFICELQEKMRILETELQLEKENNASLQIILGQAETLKCRYETMQKEFQLKDETIKSLGEEIEAANDKIFGFTDQIKDLEEKLETSHKEKELLQKRIQTENKKFEDVMGQLNELKKKYALAKSDLEREHKRAERVKMMNDMKMSELEEENEKQKNKIRDLQGKLEAALIEIKKNQNLAVSKSLVQKSNTSNTDDNSFSVSNPTTPSGTPKKNALHVQINPPSKSPVLPSPLSPEKFNVKDFELLLGAGEIAGTDKILSQIQLLNDENTTLKQKIVKLKSEQMKACEIIKTMIESRNKATEEIIQLKKHNEELEHELESVVSKPTTDGNELPLQQRVANMNITAANSNEEKSMAESQIEDLEIVEQYKALTVELEAKIEVLVATLNEKDSQMHKIRQQYEEILTLLEDKENRIVDLEFELLAIEKDGGKGELSILEKGDSGSEKHSSFYRQEIEQKDKEIEKLSVELKKCTCYLQEIVNKELWERNKEIEKLHNKQANSSEILRLKKDLMGKELQLKLLKEKISELGLDISIPSEDSFESKDLSSPSKNIQHIKVLQDQLKLCKEERDYFQKRAEELEDQTKKSDILEKLQSENKMLQTELQKCEQLRHESNEVCSILSSRLEELAIFLDSLLKQKSVLGFLGTQKNKKIREIIDNSLDLSRSFTMSMMINPDQSLAQLSNITALLNGSVFHDLTLDLPQTEQEPQSVLSIVPGNITLTYQSHLYKQNKSSEPNNEQVLTALREQIVNLKSELKLRDNELNRLNNINNKEVSDKTTETDDESHNKSCAGFKDVSKLFTTPNKCNTTSTTLKYQSDCQSESEAWSEPDRVISRARIGLSHTLPTTLKQNKEYLNESTEEETGSSLTPSKRYWNEKRHTVVDLHQQIYDLEEELKRKTVELINAEAQLLENNNLSKKQLEDLEMKLAETEDKLLEAELRKKEAESQVKALQQVVDNLTSAKKNLEETMTVKDKETQNKINLLEVEKEETSKLAQEYKKEAIEAKNEIERTEMKLKQMQEDMMEFEKSLRKEYEQHIIVKLKDAEEEFIRKLREVEEKAEQRVAQIKQECSREHVRKAEVERKLLELDRLVNELDDLKNIVKSYEDTIEGYKEKENEIREKLHEYQDKINILRKDLDNTTLQYSEAVLEKTKLANEKTLLEQELSKINIRNSEMKQQFSGIQLEFANFNQNYQQQISTLQKQKSKLEVKISELESINAELHNKLVRLQARGDFNTSMPIVGGKNIHMIPFKRQYSEQHYSSEENIEERSGFIFNRPLAQNIQPVDMERQEANSSPDLGIESDQGRFSSLETHPTLPRPLLQTIELTESMSNLLDGENNQVESVTSESEHCCQKTLEIARENNDLKKKLLRMRRALEETATQLNLANQRKKQVEKTICKQIHKTSQVLRKAKANLDSGSESDMLNKK